MPSGFQSLIDNVIRNPRLPGFACNGVVATLIFGFIWRRGQGFFYRPSKASNSVGNERCGNSSCFGPFTKQSSFPIKSQMGVAARIPTLGFLIGPAAIATRIAFIIIYAIKGEVTGRFLSHISKKRSERSAPLVAYCNAATAVIVKLLGLRIVAALKHQCPNPVFWASPLPVPFSLSHSYYFTAMAMKGQKCR